MSITPTSPRTLPLTQPTLDDLLPDWPAESAAPSPTAPTPKKRKQSDLATPYAKQHDRLSSGFFLYHGRKINTSHLADGSYSSVYQIAEGSPPLFPDLLNSSLVIKCFHGKVGPGFREHALNNYLHHASQNYLEILTLRLPVATIHNLTHLLTDRVVIQRKIANPINALNPTHLRQARLFFDASIKHNIPMDLQPQNLREENNTIYLIDFLEEADDITVHLHKSLQAWARLLPTTTLCDLAASCLGSPYLTPSIQKLISPP